MNRVEGTSRYDELGVLTDLKEWWDALGDVYSRTLQNVVERLYDNLETLHRLKEEGHRVGHLRWKSPREYRSFTYRQSGFKLHETGGRTVLSLSKIGDVPITLHREIPDDAALKQVTVKREPTGEWFASISIETGDDPPAKPDDPEKCVGIDVGILKFAHDTDGFALGSLDLSDERNRLDREHRKLSRKEHGSNNWEQQRKVVAKRHADLKRKRRDFLHRVSAYYAREYDLVAVEDLNISGMLESPSNSRNTASAAWGEFRRMLEYKCEREGTHFAAVRPGGTTKECSRCGVETDKPLWVREHSCPACGFQADRDANAARNILSRGFDDVGVVHPERTPSETATAVGTTVSPVPARRVMEQGSPALNECPQGASRAG
ncbi:transposase, IS605 OrfB family protein [Halococcus morrhuae DSM 1307]|uniref:Transposase, IS605 OrfB family protein n=1 Tax=Halococcus morrhuae DSM 1307 TaxID=931277 RepID=M0MJF0_HALMO|nr:transposase, IS605 OrfB family protein [Halococcus morrhuae DSM 1307]